MQSHEAQPFRPDDLAILLALGRGDVRGLLRQRERRDFDARVTGFADGLARFTKRPSLEGLVTHRMTEAVRHEPPVYDEEFRPATAGLRPEDQAGSRSGDYGHPPHRKGIERRWLIRG